MANIFEISKEDKENFIQALHSIFNLDRNYPDEEREFIYQLKILMGLNNFRPYTLDNEEKDLAKIIENIKNKDLIYYLFLIAEEVEKKQINKSLYKIKMQNVVNRLNPEIKNYINTKYKSSDLDMDMEKQIDEIAKKGQEVVEETLKKGKTLFNKLFNKGK